MQRSVQALLLAVVLALLAGGWWVWQYRMEDHWFPVPDGASVADPMFAAKRWLTQRGLDVRPHETLAELPLNALADGTLLVLDNGGAVTPDQHERMLAWVRRGNTLVVQPRAADSSVEVACGDVDEALDDGDEDEEDEEDEEEGDEGDEGDDGEEEVEGEASGENAGDDSAEESAESEATEEPTDAISAFGDVSPISTYLGLETARRNVPDPRSVEGGADDENEAEEEATDPLSEIAKEAEASASALQAESEKPRCLSAMPVPRAQHLIQIATSNNLLRPAADGESFERLPGLGDELGDALRGYPEGQGRIAVVAENYFDNLRLARNDHAELLWSLLQLQGTSKTVHVVNRLNMPPWHLLLWKGWPLGVVGLTLALLVAFWAAVRRFGPVLPEPALARRSLLEHVDASARWLWATPSGPRLLLEAQRAATLKLLQRRLPASALRDEQSLNAALAKSTGLSPQAVQLALVQPVSKNPAAFTEQIRLLQTLRQHHER